MAERAGKMYLNAGTQQDSEEFFCALEETISLEFISSEEFRNLWKKHWGEVQIRRSFCDNTQNAGDLIRGSMFCAGYLEG